MDGFIDTANLDMQSNPDGRTEPLQQYPDMGVPDLDGAYCGGLWENMAPPAVVAPPEEDGAVPCACPGANGPGLHICTDDGEPIEIPIPTGVIMPGINFPGPTGPSTPPSPSGNMFPMF